MTRGNEGELVRVPSQGNEFDLDASFFTGDIKNKETTFKYMSPNNNIQLDKLKLLLQNNFNSMNPYVYDKDGHLVINPERAVKIKGYTPIEEQLNILINTYNMEFYRALIKNGNQELWLIKICAPKLRSSITVELDDIYLYIVSDPCLQDAKSCIARPRERFLNIDDNNCITYAKHPHIGNSGEPCLGQYSPRLTQYAIQGSIVSYFTTLKQWANTNNGRDAFWSLSRLINKVRGSSIGIKKKRGDGYMKKYITHILPFKVVNKMVISFEKSCDNKYIRSFYPEEWRFGRNDVWGTGIYRELIQYYVNKYNNDPDNFTYNEQEMLGRAETYSALFYTLKASVYKYCEPIENVESKLDSFYYEYINGHTRPLSWNVSRTMSEVNEINKELSTLLKSKRIDKDDTSLKVMLEKLKLACNHYINKHAGVHKIKESISGPLFRIKAIEKLFGTTIDEFYSDNHKQVNLPFHTCAFIEILKIILSENTSEFSVELDKLIYNNHKFIYDLKMYMYLFISLDFNAKYIKPSNGRKVLKETQLFRLNHWFNQRELNALCKQYTSSDKTRKTLLLKKIVEDKFSNKQAMSKYEDLIIDRNWTKGYDYFELYNRAQRIYDHQTDKYISVPITKEEYKNSLKYVSNISSRLKYFNSIMEKWNSNVLNTIIDSQGLYILKARLEMILSHIVCEWVGMTTEIRLKEVKNAVKEDRKKTSTEDALRGEETKKGTKRVVNTTNHVSKDTVSINKIPNKGMVRSSVVQVPVE